MMNQTDAERMAFWSSYYDEVIESTEDSATLDYPTSRMQVEILASVLKLSGHLPGAIALDAGCGRGQLAVMAAQLGADVVAFDYSQAMIDSNVKRWPDVKVDWRVASLADPESDWFAPGLFNIVWCVEALHVVPTGDALRQLWRRVAPGGRLVSVFTNTDSPIAAAATWRNEGVPYYGIGAAGLNPMLRSLGGIATFRVQGLHWADDQRIEVFDSLRSYVDDPPPYDWALCVVKAS